MNHVRVCEGLLLILSNIPIAKTSQARKCLPYELETLLSSKSFKQLLVSSKLDAFES
jgi:hypothetical protein